MSDLAMNISEIVEGVQHVGRNYFQPMKVLKFAGKNGKKGTTPKCYEHQLAIYEPNPDIYK